MKYSPIFWGSIGGILPNLVQKAQQLVNSSPDDTLEAIIYPTFLIGVLLVACIGAVIVAAFREEDSRKALFLGIGAPALIMVVASAPTDNAQQAASKKVSSPPAVIQEQGYYVPWFINTAYADEWVKGSATESAGVPGRFVEVSAVGKSRAFSVDFLDGNKVLVSSATLPDSRSARLPVPPDAVSIRFSRDKGISEVYALPTSKDKVKKFAVSIRGERVYGFWAALGAKPQTSYQFDVEEGDAVAAPAGTEGWSYAGKFEDGHWEGPFFDFPDGKLPAAGDTVKVVYPANIRAASNKDAERVDELRLEQEVKVTSLTTKDGVNYWIKLQVKN